MELGDSSMDENGKEHQFGPDNEEHRQVEMP